jgi:hypothetical protein
MVISTCSHLSSPKPVVQSNQFVHNLFPLDYNIVSSRFKSPIKSPKPHTHHHTSLRVIVFFVFPKKINYFCNDRITSRDATQQWACQSRANHMHATRASHPFAQMICVFFSFPASLVMSSHTSLRSQILGLGAANTRSTGPAPPTRSLRLVSPPPPEARESGQAALCASGVDGETL